MLEPRAGFCKTTMTRMTRRSLVRGSSHKIMVVHLIVCVVYTLSFTSMGLFFLVRTEILQNAGGRGRSSSSQQELQSFECNTNGTLVNQPPSVPGVDGQPCRYEGHCGIGTTCVADEGSPLKGTCRKYQETGSASKMTPCVQSCSLGLPADGIVERMSNIQGAVGRPDGCILFYQRERGVRHRADVNSTTPFKVIRVDPVLKGKKKQRLSESIIQKWMMLCYKPCEAACSMGFVCQEGLCQQDEAYWNPPSDKHPMVIVSGADESYFYPLVNLAGSLRYWAPKHKLVVYNLGLRPEQVKQLQQWDIEVKWPNGIPKRYPVHLAIGKKYAWKPVAINESLHEYKQIFWLDAGSTIASPLTEPIRIVQETGIFLVKGQDSNMRLSYPCTYETFGYNKQTFIGGAHYSGNTQAYLYPSRYVNTVVIPNAECALKADCIMPEGSNLGNHRYDQTSLSILSYRHDLLIPEYTKYLAAGREQLGPDLRKPSPHIIWTSRGSSSDFWNLMPGFEGSMGEEDSFW
jgi:hypothetical protein